MSDRHPAVFPVTTKAPTCYRDGIKLDRPAYTAKKLSYSPSFACKPPPHPRVRAPFNFNALSESTCKKRFRFDKSELCVLVQLMGISEVVIREITRATAIEALGVVLYKLAVPVRWEDMEFFFGRSGSGLSNIFMPLIGVLDDKFSTLLMFNHPIAATRLEEYAQAVFDSGSPYPNIWCFIDGTVRGASPPESVDTTIEHLFE
ncbi:hypothetical protein JG687_00010778 [Phytophthora cactorum]|uniref:Uncharacterized protein n=1 Tax=Phytophthora cactorum TaxID=29920 RepID=A0A8T1UBD4_9STRA|nr:hypothetical protein JG687_00010778 [Phytophthora cactorum]